MTATGLRSVRRLLLAAVLFLVATAAQAQATRTWVSGVGDDANPCTRTAPCKTFAGAISKTAALGTISVLDPGGFGGVTITKSITIDGGGTEGSILVSGTNGVVINAAATDIVTLRNITITGVGTGLNGVRILQAGAVHLENVQISGFRGTNGAGVSVAPSVAGVIRVYVNDSTVQDNGTTAGGGGIVVQPSQVINTAMAYVTINRSHVANNTGYGVVADRNGYVTITDSNISGNRLSGVLAKSFAGGWAEAVVRYSTVSDSGSLPNNAAIHANGAGAVVHLSGNTIANNEIVFRVENTGQIRSAGDNQVQNNSTIGPAPTAETSM